MTNSEPAPRRSRGRSALEVAVLIMAVMMTGFTLWAMRGILTPLALAIFLLLMIDGLARGLVKRVKGFPPAAALPTAITVIVVVFALTIWAIVVNAGHFGSQAPAYTAKLNMLLQQISGRMGIEVPPTLDDVIDQINPAHLLGVIAGAARRIGEGAVFVLVYLGFLIASRQGFAGKAKEIFPNDLERHEAGRVFDHMRAGIESYVWVQTIIGALGATLSLLIMLALGLSHAVFWAFLIFFASYIPVLGAAISVLVPPLFGLVDFPEPWRAVALLLLLEGVHFVIAQVMQPRMQGKSLNLDPVVVLLALAFWTLIWGVPGAFLSTPLTVMAMAILAEFRSTRWIAVLLSRDGKPYFEDDPKPTLLPRR